jgi:hypothetical protein
MGRVVWALFLEERDKIKGIWINLYTRLVSEFKNQVGLSRASRSDE